MSGAEMVFIGLALLTAAGALMTVAAGSVIYALTGLVAAMFGIAGLYVFLGAPFLALVQILIYVGAVTILIAFAINIAGPFYQNPREWTTRGRTLLALLAAGIAGAALLQVLPGLQAPSPPTGPSSDAGELGRALLGRYQLPFELISILVVVGIVGAIMLALMARERE